jgi:hypothetical protein
MCNYLEIRAKWDFLNGYGSGFANWATLQNSTTQTYACMHIRTCTHVYAQKCKSNTHCHCKAKTFCVIWELTQNIITGGRDRERNSTYLKTSDIIQILKNWRLLVCKQTIPTDRSPLSVVWCQLLWVEGVAWPVQRFPLAADLIFLDRSRYFFFQAAPELSSWGWVDPVLDPLLLRKSGCARNRTQDLWICSQELWPLDHRGSLTNKHTWIIYICQ